MKELAANAARWLLTLPLAGVCSWVAWYLYDFVSRFSMVHVGVDPTSFTARVWLDGTSTAIMGYAFVYIGAVVVPSHKKKAALALGGLVLLLAGYSLVLNIPQSNYWALWDAVAVLIGAGLAVYAILVEGANVVDPLRLRQ